MAAKKRRRKRKKKIEASKKLAYWAASVATLSAASSLLLSAFGRDPATGDYQLSDPVAETTVTCAPADLQRARFAKGALAPKGLLYYPVGTPHTPDWAQVLPAAIRKTTRIMLDAPLPIIGVRGIRWLAKAIEKLDTGSGAAHSKLFIGQVVRMQEEIGTGGGGNDRLLAEVGDVVVHRQAHGLFAV